MAEGGKVYACRFSTQALYGHGEAAFIEGIRMINPSTCSTASSCTSATTR